MTHQTILMIDCSLKDRWYATHDIARLLAKGNTVIRVERLCSYGDLRWEGMTHWDCLRRLWDGARLEWIDRNLAVMQVPPGLPMGVSVLSRFIGRTIMKSSYEISRRLQARWIRNRLRGEGIVPTVLFVNHPSDLLLVGEFGEQVSCWRVYDELADLHPSPAHGDVLRSIESENLRRVGLVFTSSRAQRENRAMKHPDVHLMRNGVNSDLFSPRSPEDAYCPADLRSIPRPRIGVTGNIDFRLDYPQLSRLAERNPQWSFVFIGWVHSSDKEVFAQLVSRPNVHFLGAKPSEEMPDYLNRLDVGMIPFRVTKATNEMLPFKLFEYMAVGLPVVATDMSELRPYTETVYTAPEVMGFGDLIRKALQEDGPQRREARIEVARRNSWESRTAEMSRLIEGRLGRA